MPSIEQEVNEHEGMARKTEIHREWVRVPGIFIGAAIFATGVNIFLRPLNLYSGGFIGFSQLIAKLLQSAGFSLGNVDLAGLIYYILNLPCLIIALRVMRRRFVFKSIFAITCVTLLMTVIPIPASYILDEEIANCLIAGIMAGMGIGLILRMGACDGGMDLVGMILIQTKGKFSVGEVNIIANIVLYSICAVLFDIPTVIYSLIYSVICSLMCDKVHTQNINEQVLIITKMKNVEKLEIELMGQMRRGLTRWKAYGGYTGEESTILLAIVSKYEIPQLRAIVQSCDPKAFVILDEGVNVSGYFLKKLT